MRTLKGDIMESKKGLSEPLQAEEYIRKMMRKKRLLTGAELGNCLLCRIGYDIKEPTDEFILKTTQCWTSQADFDAYYLRLEIRDFLLLLHNSAVYAQERGYAESLNVIQVIMQIAKQAINVNQYRLLYNLIGDIEITDVRQSVLLKQVEEYMHNADNELRDDIHGLIGVLAGQTIETFTETITFALNCDAVVDLFAKHLNLDLHTYKTKQEETKRIWKGVELLDNESINNTVKTAYEKNIIDKKTHDKAINIITKASSIDTREATEDEKQEVLNALKEIKTQADFIHLREWIIKKMIKTNSFI